MKTRYLGQPLRRKITVSQRIRKMMRDLITKASAFGFGT